MLTCKRTILKVIYPDIDILHFRKSVGVIAPIGAGFVVLVALAFYEAYRPLTYPIFPPAIFKNLRGFTALVVGVLFLGMDYSSAAILWPPQINILYTQEPISFGWYIGIMGIAGTLAACAIGFIFVRAADHARVLLTAIAAALTTFSALQTLVSKCLMYPFLSGI
jgi:hypothetical protein